LIEPQIESAKLKSASFIVTKGWNSLSLFPHRHSLEGSGGCRRLDFIPRRRTSGKGANLPPPRV